jgi:Glycosyl hydrolases family 2, sugar binding domain/Glycosyl hydrolases family 2
MKNKVCVVLWFCTLVQLAPSLLRASEQIDLSGAWQVRLDPEDKGIKENWQSQAFKEQINLPGSLPERGYGNNPSMKSPWTGDVRNNEWKKPQYAPYRTADHFKMPFWLQPDKIYVGPAWYRKEVDVPGKWLGKRMVLKLERPHWETRVWVDDKMISTEDALGAPHNHDLSKAITPGKHTITVRVDNRMIVNVGPNSHSVSDHTQSNWNGLVGELILFATSPVWIEDLQIYPNAKEKKAKVVVKIGNMTGVPGKGKLKWEARGENIQHTTSSVQHKGGEIEISWKENGGDAECIVDLGPDALLWDEFSPNLYKLTATLQPASGGSDGHSTSVSFGLRDFKVKGTYFTINDRKVFLRGTLECCIFPLTGYPPTTVDYWRKIIKTCKAHGLNHIRFHSWCPPEAAFVAADELGFYYQVECSSWASSGATIGNDTPLDQWLYKEGHQITKAYGNHPSFVMMAYGNEASGPGRGFKFLDPWCAYWKKANPRVVHTSSAGWPEVKESDYHVIPGPRIHTKAPIRIKDLPPETQTDYRKIIQAAGKPIVSHEIGQWCVYPNFDEVKKYTGVLKARNFEIFKELLEKRDMGDQARDFLMASGKLQALCYKEEIEAALRTPGFAGFQLLDLHDFPGQGTALVGILDPFWDSKPYLSPEEFNRFCGVTVPLARMSKRTWTDNETFTASIEVAHFGPEPIKNAEPIWKIVSDAGAIIAKGELGTRDIPIDNAVSLGDIKVPCNKLPAPAKYTLVVNIKGVKAENNWEFWVYNKNVTCEISNVSVTAVLDASALEVLSKGGKVLLLADPKKVKSEIRIGFSPVFWNTAWFPSGSNVYTLGIRCDPNHPVFKDFPTDYHSNWQWWELIHGSAAIELDNMPPKFRPLVQPIHTWFDPKRLGLLFEAEVNGGKLMVCSMDLNSDLENRHVARQMRYSIVNYMNGAKFNPETKLTAEQVATLLKGQPAPSKK